MLGVVLVWIATGPLFQFSVTWQRSITAATTLVTFLLVFSILRFHTRESRAFRSTLDDILASLVVVSDRLVNVEKTVRAAAEERERSVVNHVLDGIITIDDQGKIATFNPAAERLFGFAASEIIGQNVKTLMPEPYRGEHDGYIVNYQRTGKAKIIGIGREVVGLRKDGSTFPMELAVSEFRVDARRFFTGIVRDITERKQAEEALRAADRQKDEFLAMLSHELRNPLAALTTAAHVLRAAAPNDSTTADAQGVIERQTEHMVRLIEDLLDITRVRFGKLSLEREPFDLAQMVSEVTESRRSAGLLEGRAPVTLDLSPVWVEADRARLEQVYANLLENAFKFTPTTGAIRVCVRKEKHQGVLSVADTGRGISADVLPTIFEPFVQGGQNLDRAQGGLGLGLALVKRLTELHAGSVTAESRGAGLGATFTVALPATLSQRGAASRRERSSRPLRVLVVDDNRDARQMLSVALAMGGHEVSEVADGSGALDVSADINPDVVLLDIGLPDLDGYEVARRLRAAPGGDSMVLIALSGYGEHHDPGRTRDAGFDAHLVKPTSAERLQQVIAELVARNPTQSE